MWRPEDGASHLTNKQENRAYLFLNVFYIKSQLPCIFTHSVAVLEITNNSISYFLNSSGEESIMACIKTDAVMIFHQNVFSWITG